MNKLYGYELPPEFKYEEIEDEFKIYLPEGGSLEGVFFTVPKEYTEGTNGRLKITLKNKDVIYLFNQKKATYQTIRCKQVWMGLERIRRK